MVFPECIAGPGRVSTRAGPGAGRPLTTWPQVTPRTDPPREGAVLPSRASVAVPGENSKKLFFIIDFPII